MSGRNALLQQIQQGKKLKKADTNDRSGPQVGKTGGGGSGPPMGMPRAPVPPVGFSVPGSSSRNGNDNGSSNGNGNGNGSIRVSSESRPAPAPVPVPAVPGLGGLFSGGIPKLRHRSGGVNTGRTSEDNGASPVSSGPPAAAPPPPPPPQQQTEQKTGSGGSRFTLPFRRSSHARSSSQADAASARSEAAQQSIYGAAKAPPPPPAFNGHSEVPGRRTSDAGAGLPPSSSPASRPGSSV
ncbi:verprolin, partial [Coemansia asiatica]